MASIGKVVKKDKAKNQIPVSEEVVKKSVARLFKQSKFNVRSEEKEEKIRSIWLPMGDAWKKEKCLIENGESFTVTRTNLTTVFKFPGTNRADLIFSKVQFTYKEMNLFQEIRKEIRYNVQNLHLKVPYLTSQDVGYYLFSDQVYKARQTGREVFDDVMEFDIVKAYYTAAYVLKYISKDFYLKCIELPKTTRLRLIGSIATSKLVFTYNEGLLENNPKINEDEVLRRVWFHICKYTDNCMRQLRQLLGQDFLFYWVDGIYCKPNDNIQDYLRFFYLRDGFEFEYKPIEKVVVEKVIPKKTEDTAIVKVNVYRVGDDPDKPTSYFLDNEAVIVKNIRDKFIKEFKNPSKTINI
jgi:hypothetical protein